jgi:DNA-binding NarL/FixJ family response regulator
MVGEALPNEAFTLLRVLVADAGSSVNDGLTALLSDLDGISVFGCAQDQLKVLALTRSLRPDVVILDVQYEEPISFALLQRLKVLPHTPIVIALCEDDVPPLQEAVSTKGADHVLARTDCEALIGLVVGLIEKRRGDG